MDIDVSDDSKAIGQPWSRWVPFLGVAILHLAAARLASLWTIEPDSAQPFWPATGVTVGAALVVSRTHRWLAVAGGIFGHGLNSAVFLESSAYNFAGDLLANGVEIVIAVLIAQRLFNGGENLDQLTRTVTGLAYCFVVASVGASIAALWFDVADRSELFWRWMVGDGLGLFTAGSVMLVGRSTEWLLDANPRERWAEFLLVNGVVALAIYLAFEVEPVLMYLIIASLLWLAVRFGPRIAVPAAALTIVLACVRTADSAGPFVATGELRLFQLQAFNATVIIAVVIVSRLSREMDQRRRALRVLNAQLKRSERRWKQLSSNGYEGVIEVDHTQTIVGVSEDYAGALGFRPGDLIGRRFTDLFSANEWQRKYADFAERVIQGETVRFDRPYQTINGATGWALTSAEPTMDENGDFDGALMFVLDTTDVHRLNEERAASELALHDLRNAERERMAQAIHDGALQEIAAATIMVGALKNDPAAEIEIGRIEETLLDAMGKLRKDAIDLTDAEIVSRNVSEALREVADKFAFPSSTQVTIEDHGIGSDVNPSVDALFRIGREALVNAIIHSRADRISVELHRPADGYLLTIEDNGIGFDLARTIRHRGHLGLRTISEQAERVGGWVTTSTPSEGGTRIEAWAPRTATFVAETPESSNSER